MICRRCRIENPETSRYCSACGALLARPVKPRPSVPRPLVFIAASLAVIAAVYFLAPWSPPSSSRAGAPASPADAPEAAAPGTTEPVSAPSAPIAAPARVSFAGPAGAPAALETSLFDGSWIALPVWAFLGPAAPRLESPEASSSEPPWLDWERGDPVVLCRFALAGTPGSPELSPYSPTVGLEWRPLGAADAAYAVDPGPLAHAGPSFRTFALVRELEAPGVLVQKGSVVGWTFGQGVARGYLWAPPDGAGPRPGLSVSDLALALRGAASREVALVQALSMGGEAADVRQLEALAAALRREALLAPDDLPFPLKPAAVASRMSLLAEAALNRGLAAEVARALDPKALAAVPYAALVKTAARAYNEARGFDSVDRLLSDLRRETAGPGAPAAARELDALQVELAKASLHKILDERGYGGRDVFETASRLAPDDLELHLLGVEQALLEKDFVRAGDLLAAKKYPAAFSDKVRTLERLVDEGRRDEDSVTIRFNPGERLIPVHAVLNGTYRQKFFIDTGATTTIIPHAAVSALGIRIDNSTPVVGFQGVAGGDLAYQVRVDSIDIEGRAVRDIRAIVYDLGDDDNSGLLGNDFLQHFQVDLDSVKGVLKLRKK